MPARHLVVVAATLAAAVAQAAPPVDATLRAGGLVVRREGFAATPGAVDLAATWRLTPRFGVELGGGHQRLESGTILVPGPDAGNPPRAVTLTYRAWHVDASAVVSAPMGPVEPYAVLGVAVYDLALAEAPDGMERPPEDVDPVLGAHAGAGLRTLASKNVLLVADVRFQLVRTPELGDALEAGLDALRVTMGVGWRF